MQDFDLKWSISTGLHCYIAATVAGRQQAAGGSFICDTHTHKHTHTVTHTYTQCFSASVSRSRVIIAVLYVKYVWFFCLLAFMFASVKPINVISLLFYWYCAVLSRDKIYLIFVVPGDSPNKPSGFEFRTVDTSFWGVVLAGWGQECASFAVWEVECRKRHEMSFLLPFLLTKFTQTNTSFKYF